MDAGNLTNRKELAITRAFFFKPSKMRSDAEARFKLGPLSCLDSRECCFACCMHYIHLGLRTHIQTYTQTQAQMLFRRGN